MSLVIGRQIKAARALLGWEQRDLATVCGISPTTVRMMERSEGDLPGRHETVRKLQRAFEEAGVTFEAGDRPGVRIDGSRLRALAS